MVHGFLDIWLGYLKYFGWSLIFPLMTSTSWIAKQMLAQYNNNQGNASVWMACVALCGSAHVAAGEKGGFGKVGHLIRICCPPQGSHNGCGLTFLSPGPKRGPKGNHHVPLGHLRRTRISSCSWCVLKSGTPKHRGPNFYPV